MSTLARSPARGRATFLVLGSLLAAAAGHGVVAQAASRAPTLPFDQCPPVGRDASCGSLIVVNPDGMVTVYSDVLQGPFDGEDDTLIGVQNNSPSRILAIPLHSKLSPLFGFDGDGLCGGYTPQPPTCPFGPTKYEGPNNTLVAEAPQSGKVVFGSSGLAPGASTYFSLEAAITRFEILTPTAVQPVNTHYVALGDSYSSGEGVRPFVNGTDGGVSGNFCHRSENAYAQLLVRSGVADPPDFWACSGAVINDFYASNGSKGRGEVAQLDRLRQASTSPGIISLTVGGNDIGFDAIGKACLRVDATIRKQLNPEYIASGCAQAKNADVTAKIVNLGLPQSAEAKVHLSLPELYRDIRAAAPAAQVYVLGYPRLTPNDPKGDCKAQAHRENGRKATGSFPNKDAVDGYIGILATINHDDVVWLNKVVDRLDLQIQTQAVAAGFHYVDTEDTFAGHDVCSNYAQGWAHGLVLYDRTNAAPPNPSSFSFHPNAAGQSALENALESSIRATARVSSSVSLNEPLALGDTLIGTAKTPSPIALISLSRDRGVAPITIAFDGSKSSTFDNGAPASYLWDFGDGSATASSSTALHQYAGPGDFDATLTVTDQAGNSDSAKHHVHVTATNQPPVAAVDVSQDPASDVSVWVDASTSTDPDGKVARVALDFGDGAKTNDASAGHVYGANGTYTVVATVTDDAGAVSVAKRSVRVSSVSRPNSLPWAVIAGGLTLLVAIALSAARRLRNHPGRTRI